MTTPYNATRPYKYNVLSNGEWEPWTGSFESKEVVLTWHEKHGIFHEGRGHVITLFKNGDKVK